MGEMQVVKRPSLSDEAISRLIDPRTGEHLVPLGVVGGRVVWPMMGAAPDPDDDEDDDNEGEDDGDENPEGDESGDDDKEEDKDARGGLEARIAALEKEKDRHVRRRGETQKELDAAKAKIADLEGKDLPALEKATKKVAELETQVTELSSALEQSRLDNAFLSDNTYNWHNPSRALQVIDLSEVEIDSDGTVHGLKGALDALAKSDPYLIKKAAEKDEEDEGSHKQGTGSTNNKSRKNKDKSDASDALLRQKYSALQR